MNPLRQSLIATGWCLSIVIGAALAPLMGQPAQVMTVGVLTVAAAWATLFVPGFRCYALLALGACFAWTGAHYQEMLLCVFAICCGLAAMRAAQEDLS